MAKYLILIYGDEQAYAAGGEEAFDESMRAHNAFSEKHGAALRGGEALRETSTATTIRTRPGDEPLVTDGPFAETKEQLAGYVLIEAPDLEAAKEIAAELPPGRVGAVELRPLWDREGLKARRVSAALSRAG